MDEPEDGTDDLVYLAGGPLAAVIIGMALVPLRGYTVASNFTFVFVILTIVVAELGGRRAALATAVASTLSLDFFLTEPYLKLTIASKHDVIAFCGLAVCGTVAAALGSDRGRYRRALRKARSEFALLHAAVREIDEGGPAEPGLKRLLDALRETLSLSGAVLRDASGRVLSSTGEAHPESPPRDTTRLEAFLPTIPNPRRPQRLPVEGQRITLRDGTREVGSLEVWARETRLSADGGCLLADLAFLMGIRLAPRTK